MKLVSHLLVPAIVATTLMGCKQASLHIPGQKALLLKFATEQFPGYTVKATSLTEKDNDNDGYVSGTITISKTIGEPGIRVIGVDVPDSGEVPSADNGSGCRFSREQPHDNRF